MKALDSKRPAANLEWLWWLSLLVLVTLLWCAAYSRWSWAAWRTPVSYLGDSWAEMATAKALASGDMLPILPKYPASLGAPFVASWNDYPNWEEGVFAWYALLARVFGIFTGSNLALLSAHLLAAASFFYVCRFLRYHRAWSFALAILFAMSGYAFARGLWHLVLTYYWHVPLGLLVAWLCLTARPFENRKLRLMCIVVAVLHGIQNPYYTGMFLQFLALASLVCLLRRQSWREILFPLFLGSVVGVTVFLMNVDTVYYHVLNGPNPGALVRIYSGVEIYALRPVELLLPAVHRLQFLQAWTRRTYYSQSMFEGESNSPYLGVIAIASLVILGWTSFRALARREGAGVPLHALGIGWIAAFSVIGGLNGIIAVFGIVIFRGTNRYSVVILALALLFLARELTRLARAWPSVAACVGAALLLTVGLLDQVPRPPTRENIRQVRQQVRSDGSFTASLEAKLPPRAMIFQLPVADYPEVPPIGGMLDYEHFRPYLQARSLRFSYGSQKGRPRERWQGEAMRFGLERAIPTLERYGFSAVLINKKGYQDRAVSLTAELRAAGRAQVVAESDDLVAVRLQPQANPVLPPEFDQNWYELEGSFADQFRWSTGDAAVILHNPDSVPKSVHIAFRVSSIQPRSLEIHFGREIVFKAAKIGPDNPAQVDVSLSLRPGENPLRFKTDRPGELPGNGDARKLAFNIANFRFVE